jgi:phage tail tape-measure protein
MVKLSRTSFGFFALAGLSAFARAGDLTGGLLATLARGADRLATGLAGVLATVFARGADATFGATDGGAAVFTEASVALVFLVVAMVDFP